MQLPNKLYSYANSTLALIPIVLRKIENGFIDVLDLYQEVRLHLSDPTDFISVMDCLYALRAIDFNEDGEVVLCL